MRPILEIKNYETGEQWLFQYQVIRPFENAWVRLTPMRDYGWFFGIRSKWFRLKVLVMEMFATGLAIVLLGYAAVIIALLLWSMFSEVVSDVFA
jgi:hypothetical protein